jgi:MFS family permease
MRVGLVLFALTSLGVALSPTTDVLVAARALQGVAGAVLVPGSLALLRTAFDDDAERRRAVATWITGANGATLVGPLVGALLVDLVSWRAVFMLNVPILAVAFAACRTLPESRDPRPRSLDRAGAALGVAAVGLPVYALIEAPHRGVDERVGCALLLGVAAAVASWSSSGAPPTRCCRSACSGRAPSRCSTSTR